MKLDAVIGTGLDQAAETARALEAIGFDGVWTLDTQHDPYLPLAVAATTTARLMLGTGIATAFTRSPMVTAMLSWDIQRSSAGRFVLGLGTQVRMHNERRFSVQFESPGPKLKEQVEALRHIWGAFQGDHDLSFNGRFYRHDYITPFFNPGPIEHPRIPVYLAAVTPYMYRLAGTIADGVHVGPFHTVKYLREHALPALDEGLARSERSREDVTLVSSVFVCVDPGDEEKMRSQIAFYGSTRTYRAVFEAHGWDDLTYRLRAATDRGAWAEASALIDDDVLEAFAISAPTWEAAGQAVRERYEGILDRVSLYARPPEDCLRIGSELLMGARGSYWHP